jgi:hypothetical protein
METVKIKGLIHKSACSDDFHFFSGDMTQYGYLIVAPYVIEYEVPVGFDPIAAEVSALNKTLDTISEKYTDQVRQLKSRIAELLCLENKSTEAV